MNCDHGDIIFVLDSSGSLGLSNWKKILEFTKDLIGSFPLGDDGMRVGVVSYGSKATVHINLNDHFSHSQLNRAIDSIPWKDQETNTSGGIRTMREFMFTQERGDRPLVPNIGIVVTDGASNRDEDLTIPEANRARDDGEYMRW